MQVGRRARGVLIFLALVAVTAVAIAIARDMADDETIKVDTLQYELGTRVADAGLVTGVGAVVGLLVWLFQQEQAQARLRLDAASQKLAARHQWLRDFALQLTTAYADVKRVRRSLQWERDEVAEDLPAALYEEGLRRLDKLQARFEILRAIAETSLVAGSSQMAKELKKIDEALSALVTERKGRPQATTTARLSLAEVEMMRAFLARSSEVEGDAEGTLFRGPHGFGVVKNAYKGVIAGLIAELQT